MDGPNFILPAIAKFWPRAETAEWFIVQWNSECGAGGCWEGGSVRGGLIVTIMYYVIIVITTGDTVGCKYGNDFSSNWSKSRIPSW